MCEPGNSDLSAVVEARGLDIECDGVKMRHIKQYGN
jgi:hypothetical protein